MSYVCTGDHGLVRHQIELAPLAGVLLALFAFAILALPPAERLTPSNGSIGEFNYGPPPIHLTLTADGTTFWNHHRISRQTLRARLRATGALSRQPALQIFATNETSWADLSRIVTEADDQGVRTIAIESDDNR